MKAIEVDAEFMLAAERHRLGPGVAARMLRAARAGHRTHDPEAPDGGCPWCEPVPAPPIHLSEPQVIGNRVLPEGLMIMMGRGRVRS